MSAQYYTFISKKQIGVIYSNNKKGNLNLSDEIVKWLYNSCCEVRGFVHNFNLEDSLSGVYNGIQAIFKNDYEAANAEIARAYKWYNTHFK